jgi:1-acyl-sn-glycerol-3-phosphate acyltransferase
MLIRSVLFTQLFNISTFLMILFWTPVFYFMRRENGWKVVKLWGLYSLWLQNKLIGTTFDFRGVENIPQEGGAIIGAKHQSTWETYTMLLFLRDPSYILKRELILLPFFGWFALKMRVISVNRGKRSKALKAMNIEAKQQYADGRQIVIYPEGTRMHSYQPTNYRYGITHMYEQIGARVVPVALNSGLFWPRRGWKVHKGTCVLEFMPVIEPGLEPEVFSHTLEKTIEDKTAQLHAEAENDPIFIASKY